MTSPVFVVEPTALAGVEAGSIVRLDGPEGRHAVTVRRLQPGESLQLVDGEGTRAAGVVATVIDKQSLDVAVADVTTEAEPHPRVAVVQALPKGDRGELAVELLTEVGVDVIVPWAAASCVTHWRGDRIERAHRRWADAALAAAKQSRRARFPVVADLASTADVVAMIADSALAVVLHEEGDLPLAGCELPDAGEVLIVVGPEGGITESERESFAAAGALIVRLGPSVLRTSSAGMAAAAALLAPSPRWRTGQGERMTS